MLLFYLSIIDTPEGKRLFEQLYNRYRGLMHSVAGKILRDSSLAEDAVHQAFLKLIPNLEKISDVTCNQTRNYLVIIVKRVSIDMLHEKNKIIEVAFDEAYTPEENAANDDELISKLESSEMQDAFAQLPENDRYVLYLMYYLDHSVKEIAAELSIKESAAKLRLMRARQRLRTIIGLDKERVLA